MKARDLMTERPEFVTPDDSVSHAARIMRDADVGSIPVVDDRSSMRLMGVITDRDIAVRHVAEGHQEDCPVEAHMSAQQLGTVRADSDQEEVTDLMEREQIRRVPVVEEGDRLIGIIAQADIATRLGPQDSAQVKEVVEKISEPTGPNR